MRSSRRKADSHRTGWARFAGQVIQAGKYTACQAFFPFIAMFCGLTERPYRRLADIHERAARGRPDFRDIVAKRFDERADCPCVADLPQRPRSISPDLPVLELKCSE